MCEEVRWWKLKTRWRSASVMLPAAILILGCVSTAVAESAAPAVPEVLSADAEPSAPVLPPEEPLAEVGEPSMAELAQKANNPLSDVWLLLMQNDITLLDGDQVGGTQPLESFKIQPVMPVPVFDQKWNLIFRPIINVVSAPIEKDAGDLFGKSSAEIAGDPRLSSLAQDPSGRTSGLGDSVLLTLLGPNTASGWVWGVGPTQIFPTATENVLGQEKWQIGPAGLLLHLGDQHGGLGFPNWNIGALVQQWWSYAGTSSRDETSQMDIQYFLNWRMNETQLIGMTPNIRVDWRADGGQKLSFPIGLGTIGLFKIGRLPIRWGAEVQYFVESPDETEPVVNFKLFFSPIILNPLK